MECEFGDTYGRAILAPFIWRWGGKRKDASRVGGEESQHGQWEVCWGRGWGCCGDDDGDDDDGDDEDDGDDAEARGMIQERGERNQ